MEPTWVGVVAVPERCPSCGGPPVERCRCLIGDMTCARGHQWHHCAGCQRTVRGPADHTRSTWEHLCAACRKAQEAGR